MRLSIFATAVFLGFLQAMPVQALSRGVSELNRRDADTSDNDAIERVQNPLLAGRLRAPTPRVAPQAQSNRSPRRRSPSTTPPTKKTTRRSQPSTSAPRSQPTTRRSQPSTSAPRSKPTTRQSSPQRRSQPKTARPARGPRPVKTSVPKSIQTKPRNAKPKAKLSKPALTKKSVASPARVAKPKTPTKSQTVRKRPQAPSTSKIPKIRTIPGKQVKPKVVTPPRNVKKLQVAPKPVGKVKSVKRKPVTSSVKKPGKPPVAVKKVRNRANVQPQKVQSNRIRRSKATVRKGADYKRRRALRRRRYETNRYWGNRRVQTRRLTRSYRPCYYCPGRGWSYSPTCYTRPSRYYIFADSLSYWPSISNYRRSSSTSSSRARNKVLMEQVEVAIRDYAELYELNALTDDIKVSQEGSIIILTGIVDREETLEDLIAIARDIDGVKYVVTDDVVVRELQEEVGLLDEDPLISESELEETHSETPFDSLETPPAPLDNFPPILRDDLFEEQLETSIPSLDLVAATTEFLP